MLLELKEDRSKSVARKKLKKKHLKNQKNQQESIVAFYSEKLCSIKSRLTAGSILTIGVGSEVGAVTDLADSSVSKAPALELGLDSSDDSSSMDLYS